MRAFSARNVMALGLLFVGFWPMASEAVDKLRVESHGEVVLLEGRLWDSGDPTRLLLQRADNRLQKVEVTDVLERSKDATQLVMHSRAQLTAALKQEFGDNFQIHATSHYVICFNTVPEYARWVGSLLERLYRGFYGHWDKRRAALTPSTAPLVVVIHRNQQSFLKHVEGDLGETAEFIPGYYNQESNRVNLYDLSRLSERQEQLAVQGVRSGSPAVQIQRVLDHPTAERNVATIIHEGTHQLCFNSGMMRRLSYTPLWLSEGMAIYFETPQLSSPKGWTTIGGINRYSLNYYKLLERDGKLLEFDEIISSDDVFRSGKTVRAAYAQSWALNYFLQKTKPQQYRDFIKLQRLHVPLQQLSAKQRQVMFTEAFGASLTQIENQMRVYFSKL